MVFEEKRHLDQKKIFSKILAMDCSTRWKNEIKRSVPISEGSKKGWGTQFPLSRAIKGGGFWPKSQGRGDSLNRGKKLGGDWGYEKFLGGYAISIILVYRTEGEGGVSTRE